MSTNNSVNTTLSGQTGTGNFVGSTSPTLITPTLGAATATSLTFSPTTGGIVGTTTNDNATSGDVGQFVSSIIPFASAITLVTATPTNITSISLTAGDWDVRGNVYFTASTVLSAYACWVSSTSATLPDQSLFSNIQGITGSIGGVPSPTIRFSLASTTTIYLSGSIGGTGTLTACGAIYARRIR